MGNIERSDVPPEQPHFCDHCDEHDMVPGAVAHRFKDERNIARDQLRGAVEALEAIANWQGASGSCRDDRNGMRKKARIALDYLGGQ